GATPNVELLGEAPDTETSGASDGPSLSRRALFGVARDQAAALIVTAEDGRSSLDRMPPHRDELLTAVRRRLADASEPRPELPIEDAFYLDWSVSDACDGCAAGDRSRPACIAACPTDAWRLARPETRGGGLRLSFDPAACLGTACSHCATACPRDALEARPARITADGGRSDRKALPVHRCRSCRTPIHAGGTGLCANCRKRQGLALGPPAR
ncbi:MAG: hypothetical protein GVY27_00670, partial [Deinococcus-Thermus bacterium]|nr:hypothetical protein [Deinococcota bacterium]